ncbi:MAG: CYTH and CHAD domain-containing protein [Chloroflexi bacterium]|nr:MAG: CYTH and CHAD domain-containing protein [Chloroflexota bacterium]
MNGAGCPAATWTPSSVSRSWPASGQRETARHLVEREVKLGAGPGFHLPELEGVADGVAAAPTEALRLETVYYDTPDLRLARWGCSLRHRAGEGWTLKLPTSGSGDLLERPELEFAGPARRPPAAALRVVRAYLRKARLEPVARLSTLRHRVRLTGNGGKRVAEVVDDEVSVLDGRRVAARFREIEVELLNGGTALVDPLLARLRSAGAGAPDPTPKHVRALGPRAAAPPEVAVPDPRRSEPAGDSVRRAIAAAVVLLMKHDPLVRLGGDPEHVHQARVATRRLRSHLRTFDELIDPDWIAPLRDELHWLGGELGAVRDGEVLLDRLRGRVAELPENDRRLGQALTNRLAAQVDSARSRLLEALDSDRYVDLIERLVEAANAPKLLPGADQPAADVLPALAAQPWDRLRAAVRLLPPDPVDTELHQIRILAKRARYAAEAAEPVLGAEAGKFARAAADLQTVLGELQDSVTAQAWLRDAGGSGRRAFVAGELSALEEAAAARARKEWPKAWRALDKKKLRSWMPS